MTLRQVVVDSRILAETIEELRLRGRACTERFVLWLGKKTDTRVLVSERYVPEYEASSDYFHVGRAAIARLLEHLRERDLMIGAQLHTHPGEAFHSEADNHWAIVRHVGALSIVLPEFGRGITPRTFVTEGKVFALSPSNDWTEIPAWVLHHYLQVTP